MSTNLPDPTATLMPALRSIADWLRVAAMKAAQVAQDPAASKVPADKLLYLLVAISQATGEVYQLELRTAQEQRGSLPDPAPIPPENLS